MLRILRGGTFPGSYVWVLILIPTILTRKAEGEYICRRKDSNNHTSREGSDAAMSQGVQQPPEAQRGKE